MALTSPLTIIAPVATLASPRLAVDNTQRRAKTRTNLPHSAAVKKFRRQFYPDINQATWNDWRWQLQNRIRSQSDLERIFALSDDERNAIIAHDGNLPTAITPYYAALMHRTDATEPLRRTHIPATAEAIVSPGEYDDPLGEDKDMAVPGLVHRYPDRVLFLVTNVCASYCRYCNRSRLVGAIEQSISPKQWDGALDYIRQHPEVRDVLVSGGDPLLLGDDKLAYLLGELRSIPHVEFIRLGSKIPVVLPQRITPALCRILKKFHPLWMSVHLTHPDELTPEVSVALNRLADAGIPLGSQTVLLRGVNDSVPVMKSLMHGLLRCRVKPYYLLQLDPIKGSAHFRTPVAKGLEIIDGLRGHTTGYAVPALIVDAPGGGGKVQLAPEYIIGRDGDDLLIRNYAGEIYRYHDPDGQLGRNQSILSAGLTG
jgi:lysine 2,3-aminomutase